MALRPSRRPRDVYVTPLDVDLLAALEATRNIVRACERLSITRDTGMYRLRRLARGIGSPVVASRRGGPSRGETTLTALGRRVLGQGAGRLRPTSARHATPRADANVLEGVWHSHPQAHVAVDDDVIVFVTFRAREGERIHVGVEPEAIVVARGRFPSSARNVLRGAVESIRRLDAMRSLVRVHVARRVGLDAAITPRSRIQLGLRPGARVFLYLKATAVLRLP